ncbi:MAG: enoyl-CoA hydratase/isomerase family protein [Vicinamibacterales bacterium]
MPSPNEKAILTDVTEGIGTVTLNKPWKLNAWDTPMRAEMAEVLRGWNGDGKVRAIIMTGAGERAFSAGQDLDETEKMKSGGDGARWFASWRDFYNAIRNLDKPCLAALNGVAAGSAYQTAMLADVRVGHRGVTMGQAEINSGIPSVTGPMIMLPRIGLSRTVELTLTARMMEAGECHAIGLIHYLVDKPEQVMVKTREVAEIMAAKPAIAMRLTKARFRQVTQKDFDEAFENGGLYQSEAFASGEPQEMMRAFFTARAARRKKRDGA